MSNQPTAQLPSYITSAKPNPPSNRAPWYKNTAPTYAGIFLWFVFWHDAVNTPNAGGGLAQGVGVALLGIVIAAFICHFLFYLVPGMLGQKTGLPLYIVGTSTFGAAGGFLMPGFLMGLLQFGWLGVNVYFSSLLLSQTVPLPPQAIMVIWGVLAAFVGLKGIQYVAKIATYLPLIPIAVLLIMVAKTIGGVGNFSPEAMSETHSQVLFSGFDTASAGRALNTMGVLAFIVTYIVGFFATAGAAGVDFGTSSRNKGDVSMGGLVGVVLAIILTAGLSVLIVAGVYGTPALKEKAVGSANKAMATEMAKAENDAKAAGKTLSDEQKEQLAASAAPNALYRTTSLISVVLGDKAAKWVMFLLAIAAFPPACFSSFIAANSFKTTLPKVNPFISVGIGAAISIGLAISGQAGNAVGVFQIIGASFGPICGAMMVDYLLSGGTWTGPRAGFNPAGWLAWAAGFIVGLMGPQMGVPAAPVAAFIVGAVVYLIAFKIGLRSRVVPITQAAPATVKA